MQLVYGGYFHDANSVSIRGWQNSYVYSENQWPKFRKVSVSLRAKLVGSNLFARAQAMQAAYSVNGQNLTMLDNSNAGVAVWTISSAATIGGVMVTNPVSFGEIQGAHGATYLYCDFAVEAMYPLATNNIYLSFQESVTFDNIDGGPIQVERIPATGKPILQNISERSFYYATQEGFYTTANAFPLPPDPIWPQWQRRQPGTQRYSRFSPKTIRGVPHEYGVRWSYQYVHTDPIDGVPNVH